MKTTGFIVYKGPSVLDGNPIVAILTTKSGNVKTGDIPQVWILRQDCKPTDAIKTGEDFSICGNCKHRRFTGGGCYVNVGQAPQSVHRTYRAGRYSADLDAAKKNIKGLTVRIGAYGDPSAVPVSVWDNLLSESKTLGYTHQWKSFPEMKRFCQASVDNQNEYDQAKSLGWFTFRVVAVGESATCGRECLSDAKGLTCKECKVCNGRKMDIFINAHGSKKNSVKSF
jgi:hypothetical protein